MPRIENWEKNTDRPRTQTWTNTENGDRVKLASSVGTVDWVVAYSRGRETFARKSEAKEFAVRYMRVNPE